MSTEKILTPVLDTDIPTNDNFFTRAIYGVNHYGVAPPQVNLSHRYGQSARGILAMDNTPLGHGANQGVWAISQGLDSSYGQPSSLRAFFHSTAGHPSGYKRGWKPLDPSFVLAKPGMGPYGDYFNIYANVLSGQVASQRLGNYVYLLSNVEWTSISATNFVITQGTLRMVKIDPEQNYTVHDWSLPTQSSQTPSSNYPLCPLPGMGRNSTSYDALPRTETFVSDDNTPFIWQTSGDISLDASNSAYSPSTISDYGVIPTVIGFADDGSGPGSWYQTYSGSVTTNHITGQVGAYFQRYRCPSNHFGFGPYLVFPWASGAYGPPELWFFMMRDTETLGSTFDIYRSKWARNQYRRNADVTLDDDPTFMQQSRQFPTGNPDGYAFSHDWYHAANKVGTVGPFPGAYVANEIAIDGPTPSAPGGALTIQYPFFRVLRDRHRIGQMSIVLASGIATSSGGSSTL